MDDAPAVVPATKDHTNRDSVLRFEKTLSNIQQVTARSGKVIAIATAGDEHIHQLVSHVLFVPPAPELLLPILDVIPVPLLAYHSAVPRPEKKVAAITSGALWSPIEEGEAEPRDPLFLPSSRTLPRRSTPPHNAAGHHPNSVILSELSESVARAFARNIQSRRESNGPAVPFRCDDFRLAAARASIEADPKGPWNVLANRNGRHARAIPAETSWSPVIRPHSWQNTNRACSAAPAARR